MYFFYGFQKVALRLSSGSERLVEITEKAYFRVYLCGEGEKMFLPSPAFLLILASVFEYRSYLGEITTV